MKEFGREGGLCWADGGIERMKEERIGIQREKREGLCLQDGGRERMEKEGIGLKARHSTGSPATPMSGQKGNKPDGC